MGRAAAVGDRLKERRDRDARGHPRLHAGQGGEVVDAGRRGVRRGNSAHRDGQDSEDHVAAAVQGLSATGGAGGGVRDIVRGMMRYFIAALLIAGAAAGGYFSRELTASKSFDTKIAFPDLSYSPSTFDLGCSVITEGSAFEDRLDGPSANAHAGIGTEKLALKLSSDAKTLSILYAYDVGNGATEPIPLTVHSKTTSYIVAAGQQLLGKTAVILDVKTWKAVVSYTGQGMLGIKGSSYLIQCR